MAETLAHATEMVAHVWSEPRARLELEAQIDGGWWEPRWDQPWRRQVARDREAFGWEYVASPRPPVEGPNNPNRLRRELAQAESELDETVNREEDAAEDVRDASFRAADLRTRLEDLGRG